MSPLQLISDKQSIKRTNPWNAFLAAVQFLTRIPVPAIPYTERTLADAMIYFPLIGLAVGAGAGLLHNLLLPHLTRPLVALTVVTATVLITGALHEDGLADCADAFGSQHPRIRTLEILRDSRIGSYGAIALALSLAARISLITALPLDRTMPILISAHVLSRWSSLPLTLLPAARPESGQGVKIAQRTPRISLIGATLFTVAVIIYLVRTAAIVPIAVACVVTAFTALFYFRRIGGITGDCFGATNQLVEIAVLACGAWIA